MTHLLKIQRAFQESLQKRNDSVLEYIAKPIEMSTIDRLQVYYNDYFFRLRDSLKEDYEKTYQLMGETEFELQVEAYIKAYPSSTYTLREIGYLFPKFLSEQKQNPALVELANLECEMIHALYTADAPHLTMENVAILDPEQWENLRFHFHPSIRKMRGVYNTLDLWTALDNNEKIESKSLEVPAIYIIWRQEKTTYFLQIDKEETILFDAIQSGVSFTHLCEKMLAYFVDEEEVVPWIAGILQVWITEGLFSGFTL